MGTVGQVAELLFEVVGSPVRVVERRRLPTSVGLGLCTPGGWGWGWGIQNSFLAQKSFAYSIRAGSAGGIVQSD